ncbi:MAG: hypothetical protein KDI42_09550 [Gammaproteobacteria bacterium]|nr:hypothetical protein [Gammaproteobacteria bacterium]
MRRSLIVSLLAPLALTLASNAQAVSVDYQKFTAEALMLMRPSIAAVDREPFREAFLEKINAMSPAERAAFQNKAMAYLAGLDEAERAGLMKDLMSYMDTMSPEQLLMLSQQIKGTPESAVAGHRQAATSEPVRPAMANRPTSVMAQGMPNWMPPAYAYPPPVYAYAQPPQYRQLSPYAGPGHAMQGYAPPGYAPPSAYGNAYGQGQGYGTAYGSGYGGGYGYPTW